MKTSNKTLPFKTTNVEPDDILNEVDAANLKEELCSCQSFIGDSEPK